MFLRKRILFLSEDIDLIAVLPLFLDQRIPFLVQVVDFLCPPSFLLTELPQLLL